MVLAALASIVTVGGRARSLAHGAPSRPATRPLGNATIIRGSPWASTLASCSASKPLERASAIDKVQTLEDSSIASDDFNACSLDADLWTFSDPVGDCAYSLTGTFTQDAKLSISVPGGSSHNVWDDGNYAPRVMQAISDTDFEIEAKFDSGLSQKYQIQGILIYQDEDHFLRLDFHSDGVGTRLYAAAFEPNPYSGSPLTHSLKHVDTIAGADVAPLYLRVRRQGDEWTLRYSFDGATWTNAVTFDHSLVVGEVGVFCGNAGSALPAHTAHIDYFFNTTSPIDPEDSARATLTVEIDGSGTVSVVPEKPSYDCGEVVTLSAEPAEWFEDWSGDLTGTDNPGTIVMTGSKSVTASFSFKPGVYLPLAMTPPFSNYLFVGDFERADLSGCFWNQNKPEVVAVDTQVDAGPGPPHPVRGGNYSMRAYLHRYNSDYSYRTMCILCERDDMPAGTREALELQIGGEYWIGFSIFVPPGFSADGDGCGELWFQFQAVPDPGELWRSPILAIHVPQDRYSITSKWDTRVFTEDMSWTGTTTLASLPVLPDRGRWVDWVFHVNWSWQGDGLVEIWKDGERIAVRDGPNCSNDREGPRISFGVYKWPWRPGSNAAANCNPSIVERLIYVDELRIAGHDGGYEAVAP